MKRLSTVVLACLLFVLGSAPAFAQAVDAHAGVAVKVGTLGIGFDVAVPVAPKVNVRGGFNVFNFSHDFDEDDITLLATLKLRSVTASLDWFPFGGGFHVSPGLMIYNGNEVDATAQVPGGKKFDLGDESLVSNPANPVTGSLTVGFEKVAPMVTIGWGNIVPRGSRRWSVPFELGLVYSRSPKATFNLTGSACNANGTNCRNIATEPQLQADLAKEQASLNDDLSFLKLIPVMTIGFSYKF